MNRPRPWTARTATGCCPLLMAQLESSGATLLVVSHDEQLRPYFGRILQMDDINTAEAA